jgi:hypothetical protein
MVSSSFFSIYHCDRVSIACLNLPKNPIASCTKYIYTSSTTVSVPSSQLGTATPFFQKGGQMNNKKHRSPPSKAYTFHLSPSRSPLLLVGQWTFPLASAIGPGKRDCPIRLDWPESSIIGCAFIRTILSLCLIVNSLLKFLFTLWRDTLMEQISWNLAGIVSQSFILYEKLD